MLILAPDPIDSEIDPGSNLKLAALQAREISGKRTTLIKLEIYRVIMFCKKVLTINKPEQDKDIHMYRFIKNSVSLFFRLHPSQTRARFH